MELPLRRVVLDSVGKPREETSEEGIIAAVAAYMEDNPVPGGEGGTVPDPGDIRVYFDNALV